MLRKSNRHCPVQSLTFPLADIEELKSYLNDKNAPFGVDLLLPKVGGSARKTNTDYTDGNLPGVDDGVDPNLVLRFGTFQS